MKKMTASLEDYLEAILLLSKEHGHAHSNEIAEAIGVRKSSVTVALRNLKKEGLIEYKPYSPVYLTKSGTIYAEKITKKHEVLTFFFKNILKVDDLKKIDRVACEMEHALDGEIFEKFVELAVKHGYKE